MQLEHEGSAGVLTLRSEANGAPVTIEVHGEGPPILLIGAGVGRELGAPLTRALRTDHAVVNFDYEPYEGWDAPPEGRTCVQMAADAVSVLDHIGLARAHVVGISRGAVSAYAMATRFEARVLSASLLVPVAPYADHVQVGTAPAEPLDEDELVAHVGRLLFSGSFVADHPQRVRDFVLEPPGSVVRVLRSEEEALPRTEIPQVPVLIVSAAQDQIVQRSNPAALDDAVPHAQWTELPGQHLALYEDPQPWAVLIRSFVAEVNAAA